MQTKTIPKRLLLAAVLCMAVFFTAVSGYAAPVSETEAVAVAKSWLAAEINSPNLKFDQNRRGMMLNKLTSPEVLYLVSQEDLVSERPPDKPVLAYVIKYQPGGYVVVSGDDRIDPIIAFDSQAEFRWDQPELNYMHFFLGRIMTARWNYLSAQQSEEKAMDVHPNWQRLRVDLSSGFRPRPAVGTTYVFWDTAPWHQGGYYNDLVVLRNGGNEVPVGCTATSMAIKMRFHSWPHTGYGSHSYNDLWGAVRYGHAVNFGAQIYNWENMPASGITSPNDDVAALMYHCGVAVDMNYELDGSVAWPSAEAMNTFFRYKGTTEITSDHESMMALSIKGGLPVVLSTSAHTVLACGYRDTMSRYFYLNVGWGGNSDGWYNLDEIPGGSDHLIDRSYPYSSPTNYIYVDGSWSTLELGHIYAPYNTLYEGDWFTPSGGRLWIRGGFVGTGGSNVTLGPSITITSYDGTASLAGKISLPNTGMIKTYAYGGVKIYD